MKDSDHNFDMGDKIFPFVNEYMESNRHAPQDCFANLKQALICLTVTVIDTMLHMETIEHRIVIIDSICDSMKQMMLLRWKSLTKQDS